MKSRLALLSIGILLTACDGGSKVIGPEDYVHFSDFFTMDESAAEEMTMDGGTPLHPALENDQHAAILTGGPQPGDRISEALLADPINSASIYAGQQ